MLRACVCVLCIRVCVCVCVCVHACVRVYVHVCVSYGGSDKSSIRYPFIHRKTQKEHPFMPTAAITFQKLKGMALLHVILGIKRLVCT